MTIRVMRGSASARLRDNNPYPVRLRPEPGLRAFPAEDVSIEFLMSAGRGGETDVHVLIAPEAFAQLAQAMMNVDPDAAVKAFGSAMVTGCQCGLDPDLYR